MERNKIQRYEMSEAATINTDVEALPKAEMFDVVVDGNTEKEFKAIKVNGEVVDIPSRHYVIVQHETAFRPVIEGLTQAGITNFEYQLYANNNRAYLNLFVGSVKDSHSTINIGFRMVNSFDRSTTVDYGINVRGHTKYFEFVGFRQVCSNGLVIRVPFAEADFIAEDITEKVQEIFKKHFAFKHNSKANERIANMQFLVEGIALLREPLQQMINKAERINLTEEQIEAILAKHFCERKRKQILAKYQYNEDTEGTSFWGLYNAITEIASHDSTIAQREHMLDKASEIFSEVVLATS